MKSTIALVVAALSLTACGSSASTDDTTATVEDTTAPAVEVTTTTISTTESEETSDEMIAKIGYGHIFDSGYLEMVRKNMNGSQMDQFSEAQLFNFARNTCTWIKAGDSKKVIDVLKETQGTVNHEFTTNMTLAALSFYCMDLREDFVDLATAAGL